ncbi:MAG TPA: GAF domain-containing protein [Aggregatilineales bacterium]|nr:GAF domain-containing protein [Aggregatilineales bacterium]
MTTKPDQPGLVSSLFPLKSYSDAIVQRQAVSTYGVAVLYILTASIYLLLDLILLWHAETSALSLTVRAICILTIVAALVAIFYTRRGYQTVGGILILALGCGLNFGLAAVHIVAPELSLVLALIGISVGALLVGEVSVFVTAPMGILTIIVARATVTEGSSMVGTALAVVFLIIDGGLNYLLAQGLRRIARQVAQTINERRLQLAESSSSATQRLLSSRLDLDVLLRDSVQLVRSAMPGIDHSQLYLIDKQRRNAELVATTYSGADAAPDKIGVGSLGVIGRATIGGQNVVVRSTVDDQTHRRTALLPDMVVELAMPLRIGEQTIGVLDLQSKSPTAFSPADIDALQGLANQVAVAIDNAQLYAEAQSRSSENQRLYEQARGNLREIERLNQQLTGVAWAEYLRSSANPPAFSIDLLSGKVEDAADWTPSLMEASRTNQVVIKPNGNYKTIALPISVRGLVIGAMEFEVAPDYDPGPEEMTILAQVIERLGLAAENVRLFEEAQRIAQREAMVNEISTRMQAMNNVEAVVAAATQSLADTFKAPRVAIRLGTPN